MIYSTHKNPSRSLHHRGSAQLLYDIFPYFATVTYDYLRHHKAWFIYCIWLVRRWINGSKVLILRHEATKYSFPRECFIPPIGGFPLFWGHFWAPECLKSAQNLTKSAQKKVISAFSTDCQNEPCSYNKKCNLIILYFTMCRQVQSGMSKRLRGGSGIAMVTKGLCDGYLGELIEKNR